MKERASTQMFDGRGRFLAAAGLFFILAQAAISWLSQFFVFGIGHAERPLIPFLFLEFLSFAIYFLAIRWISSANPSFSSGRPVLRWILFVALVSRLFYFPSNLIQETDPYRYVWDGQAVLKGANPYALSPRDAFTGHKEPARVETTGVTDTYNRINHAGVRTIYPPAAQAFFAISQALAPWNLLGWKALVFMADIGIIFLLVLILGQMHWPREWVLIYAWSPLVLKEYSNSLHVDVFAVLFLCMMVYGVVRQRLTLAFAALALSILVKWFAIVLLPLLLTWSLLKQTPAKTLGGLGMAAGILSVFYMPFAGAGRFLFEGLSRFALEWRVNEGFFGVVTWTASFVFRDLHTANGVSRLFSALILAGITGWGCYWLTKKKDIASFGKACAAALSVLFFLSPAGNPWYFTWVVPFFVFLPARSLILFSGLVFLYYLDFFFVYRGVPQNFFWVKAAEYGVFFVSLGWELWTQNRRSLLFYRLPTSAPSYGTR